MSSTFEFYDISDSQRNLANLVLNYAYGHSLNENAINVIFFENGDFGSLLRIEIDSRDILATFDIWSKDVITIEGINKNDITREVKPYLYDVKDGESVEKCIKNVFLL